MTVYDGFDGNTPAVKWFWEVVLEWPLEKQAKLLLFATGCAKAPIGGLGKLNFKIQVCYCLPLPRARRTPS